MMSSDCIQAEFSAEEFRRACLEFVEAYRRAGTEARWTPTTLAVFGFGESNAKDSGYLSLQTEISTTEGVGSRNVTIDYHVVLSASWQVPVLYFSPIWDDSQQPLSLKEVYAFIVETTSSEAVQNIGVLGGISHGVCCSSFARF